MLNVSELMFRSQVKLNARKKVRQQHTGPKVIALWYNRKHSILYIVTVLFFLSLWFRVRFSLFLFSLKCLPFYHHSDGWCALTCEFTAVKMVAITRTDTHSIILLVLSIPFTCAIIVITVIITSWGKPWNVASIFFISRLILFELLQNVHRFCYLQWYFVVFSFANMQSHLSLSPSPTHICSVCVSRFISYLGNLKQKPIFYVVYLFHPFIQQTFYLSIEFHSLSRVITFFSLSAPNPLCNP